MYTETRQSEVGSSATLTATGDKMTFTPRVPSEIVEFGFVVTTAIQDSSGDGMVLKADKRPTAGSDTDRGDGDIGSLTLTNAQSIALTAGKVARSRPNSPVVVNPGEQVVLEVTNAPATAGAALPFVVFREALANRDSSETVVTA